MNSFLKNTAAALLEKQNDLKDVCVILPNRRAGLFFSKHLGQLVSRPIWMPEVLTIEDVFYSLAKKRPGDDLTLIFELYKVYQGLGGLQEGFERFYFWGEIILKDFNDLDQFMVNAEKLFINLREQKLLEGDWSFLSRHQVDLIREFWKSFENKDRQHQERFLKFWELLSPLYQGFKTSLEVSGLAYPGMIYREVVERLENIPQPDKHHVFVGFNAFTVTEEKLIKHFIKKWGAEIHWDVDDYYIKDKKQEAGLFFRNYMKDGVFGPTFPQDLPSRICQNGAGIETYAVPLKVNQANLVGRILEEADEKDPWDETVVILPDEQLLFPLLNILPEKVDKVNVTMGYPVRNTPVYTFLEAVLELQRYTRIEEGKLYFYHRPVKDLMTTPYLMGENPVFVRQIISQLNSTNQVYLARETLTGGGRIFEMVFRQLTAANLISEMMVLIKELWSKMDEKSMERGYLFQCYKQMNRLKEIFQNEFSEEITLEFFIRTFRKVFREIRLPFEGEPLEGLQIMGVLESRNLDFRRVIVCNMNEGNFPPSSSINSMVPFNLRKAFGLPVQEQNDAIYAYTFYRLLHQAEEVHLLYTTASDQGQSGEKSRYIYQLQIELNRDKSEMEEKVVHVPVGLTENKPIIIPKTTDIMRELEKYTDQANDGRQVAFSPSAINTWLDCRLKFYLRYIAGLEEPDEVKEEVDPAIFGNLAHLALEYLYKGFIKRKGRSLIEESDFGNLDKFVFPSVEMAIRKQYHLEEGRELRLTGQLAIARDVLQKYLKAVLEIDRAATPFEIISLEATKKYRAFFPLHTVLGDRMVALGGIIDRVDLFQNTIRLIDYKSGIDSKDFKDIPGLFDRSQKKRNKAAMQTLFYGLLYHANFPDNTLPLKPAIFNLREVFRDDFSPYLHEKPDRKNNREVQSYLDYRESYEAALRMTLEEIFDPNVAFDQTEDMDKCRTCPYMGICAR